MPTPLLAFAVTQLNCDGGIMITASHNPKEDNGYKVYSKLGCQIISPTDKNITKRMIELISVQNPSLIKMGDLQDVTILNSFEMFRIYLRQLPNISQWNLPKIVYTPVHGVGWCYIHEMAPSLIPVPEQIYPDPYFPTTKFPNPEEGKKTLKLALKKADKEKAHIVMANDPDVDRFIIAEKCHKKGWKIFSGNEIASIFAHYIWAEFRRTNPSVDPQDCYMLTTSVSTRLLKKMAQVEGFMVEATFTGFKNIGNLAHQLHSSGKHVLFAFEEAIGFMIGNPK